MLEIIANISFSDTDKQVIGAVGGALLGALIGAFSTYIIGNNERKKAKNANEIERLRKRIRTSTGALVNAQTNVHNLLIMALKNMGHSEDITKGIYDEKIKKTVFNMNLQQVYLINEKLSDGILNANLTAQWDGLVTETILHNSHITDFNSYYILLRTSVHKAMLTNPKSLNLDAILSDNVTISNGAKAEVMACENFRSRCLKVLALIELHVDEYEKKIDYNKITVKELKEFHNSLVLSEPSEAELDKRIAEASKKYTQNAFAFNTRVKGSEDVVQD